MAKQGIVCPPGTRWESAYCELGKFVTTETQTIIGLAVFVLCILLVADYRLLGKPPNPAFQTRINILRERGFADNYRARLKRWLDVADHLQLLNPVRGWTDCSDQTRLPYCPTNDSLT